MDKHYEDSLGEGKKIVEQGNSCSTAHPGDKSKSNDEHPDYTG